MTATEAQQIKQEYNRYDEEFRAAKKRGDHRQASEWKTKRDALYPRFLEAIKVK